MNKGELVDEIAQKGEVTKKDADAILSATLDTILDTVPSGDKVTLVGLVPLRCESAQHGRDAILQQAQSFRFQRRGCPHSQQANCSRKRWLALRRKPQRVKSQSQNKGFDRVLTHCRKKPLNYQGLHLVMREGE